MSHTTTAVELDAFHGDSKAPARFSTSEAAGAVEERSEGSTTTTEDAPSYSILRCSVIFAALTGVTTASSLTTGLLAVALPKMAADLEIPNSLLLWPASIYGLTSGCSLLIAGSIADAVGSRIVYLVGCLLLALCALASALAQTSTQLIVFRGFQGIAASCCLPTAVSILSENFPGGRRRNIGFALLGSGQPLGYSLGLFLGGFFVDSVGWRYAWYLSAGIAFVVLLAAVWALPPDSVNGKLTLKQFFQRIDWIGAFIASASLGMLSYVLAVVSEGSSRIKDAENIVLLCIACALIPVFIFWMNFRVKQAKPALIPNYLWRKASFSSICLMVFLTWAAVQTVEYYFSLFFQKVQGLSAMQTSLRFLPNVLIGIVLSVVTGMVIHKWSAYWVVLGVSLVSAISPLLLAIANPNWSYWYALFWAMLLSPLAGDVLFVISNLVITSVFPGTTQALAGAVFNTVSQFGTAVGLAIMAVISSSVTDKSHFPDKDSPDALLEGYRASFWVCFAATLFSCAIGVVGLRSVGKIGIKQE
ncbi:uncharacterized protein K452DRAFT_272011 [Aplosporella prunicola CBS 121167]|uniref:Major facilitator superfamily (MFS) profile domain-containing protein n=1 Tax=Aplosporella prunicola CBS 121167 TaxID=1176127 RepID=A0A6A6BB21_9PEZI|nr:uncharacterized protein K452DRAFT_272011 [Aplosporella prunicola CBS 121167]KAF2141290.1 hypothetical protein K452DRAFT_272011 [Aplosporella prunicola CBS 121167]